MAVEILGIKTCSSCQKAMKWLEENNIEYSWTDFRQRSPTQSTVESWVRALGNKKLRNTSGKSYRNLGEEKKNWDDKQWVNAFSLDAMLIKRPVLVIDGKAIETGFKAERYAELLT